MHVEIERLQRDIVNLLAERQILIERNQEMAVTLNQYKQAVAILDAKVAAAEQTITSQSAQIQQLQSQSTDYTTEATDALQAAAVLDPTVNTDPTQLPDVDPNAPQTTPATPSQTPTTTAAPAGQ